MDLNEIFEYVTEGMKWLGIGGGSYIGAILGCQFYGCWPFHRKIKSQKELEIVVKEECDKLGINHTEIDSFYNGQHSGSMRKNKNTNRWGLYAGGWQSTRSTVRHELYHYLKDIPRVNKGDQLNEFYYFFVAEPRATLYETFRIKL